MKKILLPIDLPNPSVKLVHEATFLARHFQSEIVLLNVVSPLNYPAGALEGGHELTARDLHAEIVKQAQKQLGESMRGEVDGIPVKRVLRKGDPATEIVQTAQDENADLIVISTHGAGGFYRFLLGSVAAKVLHDSDCAVWTDAHVDEAPSREFALRSILCAVDLSEHSRTTVSRASQFAAEFGARLTIVHITDSVENFGPGGSYVVPEWKQELVGSATREIAKLQQELGIHAEVIIDSGDVHKLLNRAAEKSEADLLVIGHMPPGGHLGENGSGYSTIRESHIPVLSL